MGIYEMRMARQKKTGEPEKRKLGLLGLPRETEEVLRIITDALRGFPEARAAVVAALKRERGVSVN